jgi:hypothetical protein
MGARFGTILSDLVLGAGEAVRRNADDTAFEVYDTMNIAFSDSANLDAILSSSWHLHCTPLVPP